LNREHITGVVAGNRKTSRFATAHIKSEPTSPRSNLLSNKKKKNIIAAANRPQIRPIATEPIKPFPLNNTFINKGDYMKLKNLFLSIAILLTINSLSFAADTYQFDLNHSSIGFSVKHLVITNVKGSFTDFSGTVVYDSADITKSSVNVTIKAASINTAIEARDNHLRSADFFDVEKYPEITFQSTKVEKTPDGLVTFGKFTMHGVTKEISIPFTLSGPIKGPGGDLRLGVEADLVIDRFDYGLTWSKLTEAGGLMVGNVVKIELNIEAAAKP
jgi:polyisoprenoid-binding protein YceI